MELNIVTATFDYEIHSKLLRETGIVYTGFGGRNATVSEVFNDEETFTGNQNYNEKTFNPFVSISYNVIYGLDAVYNYFITNGDESDKNRMEFIIKYRF